MQPKEFLTTVVTTPAGLFCLALKTEGPWVEQFYKWPADVDKILRDAAELRERGNVYFSAHLFSEPRSLKKYALPSRTLQADLDEADINTLSVLPTVLVRTSPGRHQAFWVLDKELPPPELEKYARRIAYGVPDCDRTGWTAGHKVRMPHTYNYKRPPAKPMIEIAGTSFRELKPDVLNAFPELQIDEKQAQVDVDWIENDPDELPISTAELLTSLRASLPAKIYSQYVRPSRDRSAALWAFNSECLRLGCSREQVFWLAKGNANNKFADRPGGTADRDLRRDILRADQALQTRQLDLKGICMDIRRRGNKTARERAGELSQVVLSHMREHGEFVHAKSGLLWYLRKDTGRPIVLTVHSEWLLGYLNSTFGLNLTEAYTRHVIHDLQTYCQQVPQSTDLQSLSYYDKFSGKLMLHTGSRDVLHISKDTVEIHPNGFGSIVFHWLGQTDTWSLDKPLDKSHGEWHEALFDIHTANVLGLTREECLACWRAWFLFLLFRNTATSRPILALVGQPGCLSGDTQMYVRKGSGRAIKCTLADVYDRTIQKPWIDSSTPLRVLSLSNGVERVISWRNVRTVIHSGRKPTYTITVGHTLSIRATADHRFLTTYGYRPLHALRVGDSVYVQGATCELSPGITSSDLWNPNISTITSITPYGVEDTYDIEMEDSETPNFIANGIVVHNSGKTVLAKKLYKLVYGTYKNIAGLGSPEDFDLSTATQPLVGYDNLDTWLPWLPDKLATATSDTDVEKRKLYTDLDQVVFRRQAMLILTAHNPRFTREDVVDRLLLFQFSRLARFESETEMINNILNMRNSMWTSIVRDVQKVLATPKPAHAEAPQFRIEDYAYIGLWVSRAHSPQMEAAFLSGVEKLQGGQRTMTLEQDQLLVSALYRYVEAEKGNFTYRKSDAIYGRLMTLPGVDAAMFQRQFKMPLHLAKKLWTMQEALKQVFRIEWKYDDNNVSKLWLIAPKER